VLVIVGPAGGRIEAAVERYAAGPALPFATPPLGARLWVAATPQSAGAARARLARTAPGSWLAPGVRSLRRTADALVGASSPDIHPLTAVPQRAIVAEVVQRSIAAARQREAPHPLEELGASPGLVDLLIRRFAEIASLERPEPVIAGMLRAEGPVGDAIHRLWRDYRQALDKHALLDADGRLERAATLWAQSDARLGVLAIELDALRTPLERRFAVGLADRADRVLLIAPGDRASVESALAADASAPARLPAAAERVAEWARAFPGGLEIIAVDAPRGRATAIDRVASRLFVDDLIEQGNEERSPAAVHGMEVLVGTNEQDATRRAARRVKELLTTGGAEPHEVVVTARRLPDRGRRLAEALAEYGIAADLGPPAKLGDAPVMGALVDLMSVATTDWGYDELLRLVCRSDLTRLDPWLGTTGWSGARGATEWFLRELQAPSGRRYVLGHAASVAARGANDDEDDADAAGPSRRAVAARGASATLGALAEALDSLPGSATPLAWIDALRSAVATLGYEPQDGPPISAGQAVADSAAWELLERSAAELEHLASLRGKHPPAWDASACLAMLREWRTRLTARGAASAPGAVRVEQADSAASTGAPWLVVVGLDELSFASGAATPATADTGDAPAATVQDESMLAFYELVNSAERGLVLVYAGLDERAQPLEPSPFVGEVERLFPPGALRRESADTADAAPLSMREWRTAAVTAALAGDAEPLASLLRAQGPLATPLVAGLDAIARRASGDTFGPFEGAFGQSASDAAATLAERYGPARLWSASQLETYAQCRFKFFARYELGAESPGDLRLDVDYRRRGSLLHNALAEVHQQLAAMPADADLDGDRLAEMLRAALVDPRRTASLPRHEAALAAIEVEQALTWADEYGKQHGAYTAGLAKLGVALGPALFEVRFGPPRNVDSAEDQHSTDDPLSVALPGGETLLLQGRIDRVDVDDARSAFAVIDYKTASTVSAAKPHEVQDGVKLQPLLYALAVERMLVPGAVPVATGYWGVQDKGFVEGGGAPPAERSTRGVATTKEWRAHVARVLQQIETLVRSIRAGDFPMDNPDPKCGASCDYRTICRVAHARQLGRTRPMGEADAGASP
jgi:RecB family exonuclease